MDILVFAALVAFAVSTVLCVIGKNWSLGLIAGGLFLLTLQDMVPKLG